MAVSVSDFAFTPATANASQGATVQWNFKGPSRHTATAAMGLFNSGTKSASTSYSFVFVAAGKYAYQCTLHPSQMKGTVAVPMRRSPSSGTTTTAFVLTWASSSPPAGHVVDVQVKRPGTTSFVNWKTNQTARQASFTPDAGAGTYAFRSRLRNTSTAKASSYSAPVSIAVS